MAAPRIYLASASPRRLALLAGLGLPVTPCAAPVDERPQRGETPEARVRRVAAAKVEAAAARLGAVEDDAVVLGADTTVVLDGASLDKPAGPDEAASMLRLLAGRTHEVWTGVHVLRPATGGAAGGAERTRVQFRAYDEATVTWYVETGEPLDKAGAYGIQGRGVLLVERIEGSWSNVVGLPLEIVPAMLGAVGVRFPP